MGLRWRMLLLLFSAVVPSFVPHRSMDFDGGKLPSVVGDSAMVREAFDQLHRRGSDALKNLGVFWALVNEPPARSIAAI